MTEQLILYLQYPFVRRALIAGILIALCSSLLGVTLVLRHFSFIGDGLSHVAFGAMAIAGALRLTNETMLVLPLTILSAVLLLKTGQNTRIKGDAAIAMLSVGALAFGYLVMNLFSTSSNLSGDVCSTLFGATSILTLTLHEVVLSVVLSAAVVIVFVLFYTKIFAVTFDEAFAKASGTKTDRYNLLIAVVTAVVIVLAMKLAGSLLISALVVFPALSAMRLFHSFLSVTICAAILSVVCAVSGILLSILAGTPVGATIVAVQVLVFAICCAARIKVKRGLLPLLLLLVFASVLTGCGNNAGAARSGGGVEGGADAGGTASSSTKAGGAATSGAEADGAGGALQSGGTIADGTAMGSADTSQSNPTAANNTTANNVSTDTSIAGTSQNGNNTTDNNTATGGTAMNGAAADSAGSATDGIDVDLTTLSSTMVFAEVFNIMCVPEEYVGKTIKMHGIFVPWHDEVTGNDYFACIIQDATACCAQGIEFALKDESLIDTLTQGEEITVTGVFDIYTEDGCTYCVLRGATLE